MQAGHDVQMERNSLVMANVYAASKSVPSVTLECGQLRHLVCIVHLNRAILQDKTMLAVLK